MGDGMAQFIEKYQSIKMIDKYNLYCHYVAGLVGYGLSSLFSFSRLENKDLHTENNLSNSIGLFLQKTNIIRDYFENLSIFCNFTANGNGNTGTIISQSISFYIDYQNT